LKKLFAEGGPARGAEPQLRALGAVDRAPRI
jgi:hypothetical protein